MPSGCKIRIPSQISPTGMTRSVSSFSRTVLPRNAHAALPPIASKAHARIGPRRESEYIEFSSCIRWRTLSFLRCFDERLSPPVFVGGIAVNDGFDGFQRLKRRWFPAVRPGDIRHHAGLDRSLESITFLMRAPSRVNSWTRPDILRVQPVRRPSSSKW